MAVKIIDEKGEVTKAQKGDFVKVVYMAEGTLVTLHRIVEASTVLLQFKDGPDDVAIVFPPDTLGLMLSREARRAVEKTPQRVARPGWAIPMFVEAATGLECEYTNLASSDREDIYQLV